MHRVVFFGLDGAFSATCLRALAASQLAPVLVVRGLHGGQQLSRTPIVQSHPARPTGIRAVLRALLPARKKAAPAPALQSSLLAAAHALGIDVLDVQDCRVLRLRARLRALQPHALVVAGFHQLLPPELLALAERGGINVHPGRLPAQRGPSPVFWSLRDGQTTLGFTLHLLDAAEDAGDVIAAGEYAIEPGTALPAAHARCAEAAAPVLVRALRDLLQGVVVRVRQSREGVGRCPRPSFRDGKIDPTRSAEAVYTFVAGCAESYPLYLDAGGDRFFVQRALSYDPAGKLGFEYVLSGDRMFVRCCPGVVEVELKPDGVLYSAGEAGL